MEAGKRRQEAASGIPARAERVVMHLDMDAFYASVEQVDHPDLRGRPVIVGGRRRGVVSAASYEARRFGVRSAMPIGEARARCPHGVFLPVRMARYLEVSSKVMALLRDLSPVVEPTSVDEAYVDLTGTERLHGPPLEVARRLKARVVAATGCTASVGIAGNRLLAKMASESRKPDGLVVLSAAAVHEFLDPLPVRALPGVGPKTEAALRRRGIVTLGQIRGLPQALIEQWFGAWGGSLWERARGIDHTPLHTDRDPQSCGAENTFATDLTDFETMRRQVYRLAARVARELRADNRRGRTITLKIRFAGFETHTRQATLSTPTHGTRAIFATAERLLREAWPPGRPVRLLGVTVARFGCEPTQPGLFDGNEPARDEALDRVLDRIGERFGPAVVRRGLDMPDDEDPEGTGNPSESPRRGEPDWPD